MFWSLVSPRYLVPCTSYLQNGNAFPSGNEPGGYSTRSSYSANILWYDTHSGHEFAGLICQCWQKSRSKPYENEFTSIHALLVVRNTLQLHVVATQSIHDSSRYPRDFCLDLMLPWAKKRLDPKFEYLDCREPISIVGYLWTSV